MQKFTINVIHGSNGKEGKINNQTGNSNEDNMKVSELSKK